MANQRQVTQRRTAGARGTRPELRDVALRQAVVARAMKLIMACHTYRSATDIVNAENPGLDISHKTLYVWVHDALQPIYDEAVETRRAQLLEQIATAKRALWKRVEKGDDKAITSWTRLIDREMRLTGAEAPVKHELTVGPTAKSDADDFEKLMASMDDDGNVIQGEVVRGELESGE